MVARAFRVLRRQAGKPTPAGSGCYCRVRRSITTIASSSVITRTLASIRHHLQSGAGGSLPESLLGLVQGIRHSPTVAVALSHDVSCMYHDVSGWPEPAATRLCRVDPVRALRDGAARRDAARLLSRGASRASAPTGPAPSSGAPTGRCRRWRCRTALDACWGRSSLRSSTCLTTSAMAPAGGGCGPPSPRRPHSGRVPISSTSRSSSSPHGRSGGASANTSSPNSMRPGCPTT